MPQRRTFWAMVRPRPRRRLLPALSARLVANPLQQGHQVGTILVGYRGELQSQAVTRNMASHHGFGPDVSFLDEKLKLSFRALGLRNWRRQEQPAYTQIGNARNVLSFATAPIDPYVFRRLDPRTRPSRIYRLGQNSTHKSPRALRSRPGSCEAGRKAGSSNNGLIGSRQSGKYLKRLSVFVPASVVRSFARNKPFGKGGRTMP